MSEKRMEDVEELRMVLGAITDFVKGLKEPLQDLLKTVAEALSGEQLGREVANFYNELIRTGVPEDMAKEMTREFFQRKLEAAPSIGKLLESFTKFKGPTVFVKTRGREGCEAAIKALSSLSIEDPEKKEKLEKTLALVRALCEQEEGSREEQGD